MVRIQFIEVNEGFVDVVDNTVVPLNFGAAEIRDLSVKKGVYSQSIELTGSKGNAIRMNKYFDVNIISGEFDVAKKQKINLIQNGVVIREDMYLQLKDVRIKKRKVISYVVEVKDAVADLFSVINNRELTDLNFGDDNHLLTADNVVSTFGNTAADKYKYHLTSNDDNEFQLLQFKPAIYGVEYWDRIIRGAGFGWEWEGMEDADTQFDKYLIPCNVAKVGDGVADQVRAELGVYEQEITSINLGTGATPEVQFVVDEEVEDAFNLYDPVTGVYTSNLNYPAGASLSFEFQLTFELRAKNNYNGVVSPKITGASINRYRPFVGIIKNGSAAVGVSEIQTYATINIGDSLNPLEDKLMHSITVSLPVNCSGVLSGDQLTTMLTSVFSSSNGDVIEWTDFGGLGTARDVDIKLVVKDLSLSIKPNSSAGFYYGQVVEMNKFIPNKIKQSDFIKAIMTMNNLWVEIDEANPNKLNFVKRDKYLDEGKVKDWSEKLELGRDYSIKFLSDVTKKKTVLTYKEDKDTLNEAYLDTVREIYGQVEYTYDSEFVRDTDEKEVIFSPTPLHSTTFGAIVPAINGADPKMNIRVLLDGGVLSCGSFLIREAPTQAVTVSTGYPYVGHFDNPIFPSFDINWAVCDYYFYNALQSNTNNGLFNVNWRRYMNAINKGRLFTGLFWLDELDIETFKPNDKMWVEGAYWHVNKIEAYNANKRQLTKVELIPVDTEVKILFNTRFKPPLPVGDDPVGLVQGVSPTRPAGVGFGNTITAPVQEWIAEAMSSINSNLGHGGVKFMGKNNTATGSVKNALVIGDGFAIEKDGLAVERVMFPNGREWNGEKIPLIKRLTISSEGILNMKDEPILLLEELGEGEYYDIEKLTMRNRFSGRDYRVAGNFLVNYSEVSFEVDRDFIHRVLGDSVSISYGVTGAGYVDGVAGVFITVSGNRSPIRGRGEIDVELEYFIKKIRG